MFGSRLDQTVRYAELLAGPGTVRGLIGPREVPRLWERHLLNCAAVSDLIPEGTSVCDVGSGAGLPGLVIALRRPDLQVTLVEPLLRRTTFLEEVVPLLELPNVEVVRARAEALHGDCSFGVVTSRAVANLRTLAEWCVPLVAPGGLLLAMKGEAAATELHDARQALERLGARKPAIVHIDVGGASFPTTVVRAEIAGPSPLGLASRERRRRRPGRG